MTMTSTRPYLIRAFYDWIIDNDCTPHVVINASVAGVDVPEDYVEAGQIVLNIAVSAVNGLLLGDRAIEFQARFGGKVRRIYAPIQSIIAIYAKENGRGMVFAEDDDDSSPGALGAGMTTTLGTSGSRSGGSGAAAGKRMTTTLGSGMTTVQTGQTVPGRGSNSSSSSSSSSSKGSSGTKTLSGPRGLNKDDPNKGKKKPHLTIVK